MVADGSTARRVAAYEAFAEGRLQEAQGLLDAELEASGSDFQLLNDLAVVAFRLGRTDLSQAYFQQAQQLRMAQDGLLIGNLIDALAGVKPQAAVGEAARQPVSGEASDGHFARWLADSASALHTKARQSSDEVWAAALYASVDGEAFHDHLLPAFIDCETQRVFVGSSGVPALQEADRFIRVLLGQLNKHGLALTDASVAVDFGSGWGRYTRFMLKYVHPDNLYGLEVSPQMVEHCRKAFGMANFLKVDSMPPCPLRSVMVDLIFGYSVFSHLAPHCADAWVDEFARITQAGGLVLMTTQGRSFIEFCRQVRESGDRSHPWFVSLAKAFVDTDQAYRDYDAGQMLHFGEGQYGGTYGESLIPHGYIESHWGKYFDLVDFIDDRGVLPQALFVLRRKDVPYV